jgi:FAD-dependent urate hydroxylase
LRLVEKHITRWGDRYHAPEDMASPVLDAHPYLGPGFSFLSRDEMGKRYLHGLFAYNYSALISCGIAASALSGMKFGIPKLVSAVADQLFLDDRDEILKNFFA